MNEIITTNVHATMSSLEIAKLTGKSHSKVLVDIRRILDEADIGHADLSGSYITIQNKELSCFNLPRFECDLVVSGYSVKYRAAIIKRWHELENSQPKIPTNYIGALQLLIESEIAKQKLINENAKLTTIIDNEFGYSSILRAAIYAGVHESTFSWRTLKSITLGLGMEVRKVPSPRFGYMNLYPIKAFQTAYTEIDFDDLKPELIEDKALLVIS